MDLNLWKNKEELLKFLENLGIEYRYGCFEENNPESCHLLGDYLLSIDKARTEAAGVYKNNCENNKHGLSCDAYGRMAFRGQGMEGPDAELALEYFIRGCDYDEPRACYHGGQMLGVKDRKLNRRIPPDPDRSLTMLTKACMSRKQPLACTLVHSFYLRGFQGREPNLKLSADFAQIACDQDEYQGCYNLSKMYHVGDGVNPDQEKSKYYMQRAKQIMSGVKRTLQANSNATPDA